MKFAAAGWSRDRVDEALCRPQVPGAAAAPQRRRGGDPVRSRGAKDLSGAQRPLLAASRNPQDR
jgi:hypothetical protein